MAKDGEAGFTRVALLLVIIVAVVAAIAVPVLTKHKSAASTSSAKKAAVPFLSTQIDKGYDASMKSDLRTVAEEIESQNVENLDYTKTTWKTAAGPLAGSSISGIDQPVGAGTMNVSSGNTIVWVGATASSFCLEATNSKSFDAPWFYSNVAGGLSQTPCTT
jgi:type IV pilus assembly protein PilA